MKAILSAVSVLGLALVFGLSEPAPASHQPVTSDDVQMVSEEMSADIGPTAGKNGNDGKNGRGNRGRGGGRYFR